MIDSQENRHQGRSVRFGLGACEFSLSFDLGACEFFLKLQAESRCDLSLSFELGVKEFLDFEKTISSIQNSDIFKVAYESKIFCHEA